MKRGDYQPARSGQRVVWPTVLAALALISALATTRGEAQPSTRGGALPIHVAVALEGERPVVTRAWLDSQVEMANRIFDDAGLSFVLADVRTMPAEHARLEDRAARHALGMLMHDSVINWFAVGSLRDVDDPSRMRMGVHWRPATRPGGHVVIVAAHAEEDVLAHELGHYFGNREHPDVPGNIMSYRDTPPGVLPFFDGIQKRRIRRFAQRFVETGELVPGE
jgi:hypothetical protein